MTCELNDKSMFRKEWKVGTVLLLIFSDFIAFVNIGGKEVRKLTVFCCGRKKKVIVSLFFECHTRNYAGSYSVETDVQKLCLVNEIRVERWGVKASSSKKIMTVNLGIKTRSEVRREIARTRSKFILHASEYLNYHYGHSLIL